MQSSPSYTQPVPNSHRQSFSAFNPEFSQSRNSGQKVWTEDGAENAGDSIEVPSPPPPVALTCRPFPRSIPLSAEAESHPARQLRTHQRSLTALLPFRPTHTTSNSPERQEDIEDFMPTFTGDREGKIKVEDRSRGGFASWFAGSSAPVTLGVPISEKELPTPPSMFSSRSASPERPGKLKKRPTLASLESSASMSTPKPQTSRFNFFSPKTPIKNTIQLPADMINDDEFLSLDITAALFPPGSPQDPFSPSSFNNLLMNAEGLLLKIQTAYKLRTLSLHELNAEISATTDELEEANTRTQCLRTQLQDMAARNVEQDAMIADLATQLAQEKQTRAEEKTAREKSIALIKGNARNFCNTESTEDLGIANATSPRRNKKWRGSADLSTEGESDNESGGGESVFSRSRSPTLTTSSMSTMESTPEVHQATFGRMLPNMNPPSLRPKVPLQQKSTFQKILQGITPASASETEDEFGGTGIGIDGCSNCRGKDASVAWDTVGLLRVENKGLKEQVSAMEDGVDGALALCYGYDIK